MSDPGDLRVSYDAVAWCPEVEDAICNAVGRQPDYSGMGQSVRDMGWAGLSPLQRRAAMARLGNMDVPGLTAFGGWVTSNAPRCDSPRSSEED